LRGLNFIPAALVALLVTAVFTVALQPVARKIGLVDHPGGRKIHSGIVPIIGGGAMFIGMFVGLSLAHVPLHLLLSVFLASSLLVVIGVLDDRLGTPVMLRIAMQIAVVLIMVYGAGLPLHDIGDPFGTGMISMGPVTLVITIAVALTIINAYNLIDGLDGLAGSLALVALFAISVVGGYGAPSTAIAMTCAAAVGGFIVFNFPTTRNRPLRVFMGDAGSTLLGFTIVWVTIGISQGPDRLISPVFCLWFASIPIYDTLTCFVRRSLNGKSPFTSGHDHFHHTLRRGGFGVRQNVGILTGLQITYAVTALVGLFAGIPDVVMFTAWSVLGLSQWYVIKRIAKLYRRSRLRKVSASLAYAGLSDSIKLSLFRIEHRSSSFEFDLQFNPTSGSRQEFYEGIDAESIDLAANQVTDTRLMDIQ